jgi:hypothetical protein
MRTLRARWRGQSLVEFAVVGPLVILLILACLGFGWSTWQRSMVDHQISTLASDLPDDWESYDADELVKKLICDGTLLDEDKVEVENARVTTRKVDSPSSSTVSVDGTDETLRATDTKTYVTVSATVRYDLTGPLALGGSIEYVREVKGDYLAERRYEFSWDE